MVTGNNWGTY